MAPEILTIKRIPETALQNPEFFGNKEYIDPTAATGITFPPENADRVERGDLIIQPDLPPEIFPLPNDLFAPGEVTFIAMLSQGEKYPAAFLSKMLERLELGEHSTRKVPNFTNTNSQTRRYLGLVDEVRVAVESGDGHKPYGARLREVTNLHIPNGNLLALLLAQAEARENIFDQTGHSFEEIFPLFQINSNVRLLGLYKNILAGRKIDQRDGKMLVIINTDETFWQDLGLQKPRFNYKSWNHRSKFELPEQKPHVLFDFDQTLTKEEKANTKPDWNVIVTQEQLNHIDTVVREISGIMTRYHELVGTKEGRHELKDYFTTGFDSSGTRVIDPERHSLWNLVEAVKRDLAIKFSQERAKKNK